VILLSGEQVALKLENKRARHPQSLNEFSSLRILDGSHGVEVMSVGTDGEYNYMVMELLALEHLITPRKQKMSLKTVFMLAIQMLERIELVHSNHCLHRDVYQDKGSQVQHSS
jgi:serine/threonine protein kinase